MRMTIIAKAAITKRRKDRKLVLQNRLRSVLFRYFDHEDAGLKDKHERVVIRLRAAIKKLTNLA